MGRKKAIKGMIKEMVECEDWKEVLTDSSLSRWIKTSLQNNESSLLIKNSYPPNHYYATLFLITLNAQNNSFNLLPILKSIHPNDKEIFTFFFEEILGKRKPDSIKNSPLKALIESLISTIIEPIKEGR